jgi:hypothetical protein
MHESLTQQMSQIVAQSIELNARVDALKAVVGALLRRMNLPAHHLDDQIESLVKTVHQKRLERLEKFDPASTALIDDRDPSELKDLNLAALDVIRFLEEE